MPEPEEVEVFDVSDIVERAVKTAVEVFIAGIPVTALMGIEAPVLVAAATAAGSAFLSVAVNSVQDWAQSRKSRVQV